MILRFLVVYVVAFFTVEAFAEIEPGKVIAEVVWVDSVVSADGTPNFRILLSQLMLNDSDAQEWSIGEQVYVSEVPLFTPAIASYTPNKKVLVWSEQFGAKVAIRFKAFDTEGWSKANDLSDYGYENLGPSLIIDGNQQAWVFWAAHRGDNDDIFYSTYVGGGWSAARRLHAPNKVADYAALASLNEEGNIDVTWKSFSPTLGDYVKASKVIEINLPAFVQPEVSETTISDIVVPVFLPRDAAHSIHFPSNRLIKSVPLNRR